MASRLLSDSDKATLEFQADQTYNSLIRAVRSRNVMDTRWAHELSNEFGKTVSGVARYAPVMEWNRSTQRAMELDRFILQYALEWKSSLQLYNASQVEKGGMSMPTHETDITLETLKNAIDTKAPYLKISAMAKSLSDAGEFSGILHALAYVRLGKPKEPI